MMDWRRFVGTVAGGLLVAPETSIAQSAGTVKRIGYLSSSSPTSGFQAPFQQGLRELGWIAGQNIEIEYRFAEGKAERLPDLAAQLVQLKPDVIFAFGGDVAPFAKRATTSIPIVAWMSNDPVESGIVASLGRPGGNVTGITLVYDRSEERR